MDKRIKALWLQALKSGKYLQGKSQLRSENNFCCLGVLCDLAVREGVIPPPREHSTMMNGDFVYVYHYGDTSEVGFLPREVVKWSGVAEPNPCAGDVCLSSLNDDGATFEEISQVIEQYL